MPVSIQTTLGHDEWLHDEAWWCASLLRARLEAVEAARAADIRAHGLAVAELNRLTRELGEAKWTISLLKTEMDAIAMHGRDAGLSAPCAECGGSRWSKFNDGHGGAIPCQSCANGGGGD